VNAESEALSMSVVVRCIACEHVEEAVGPSAAYDAHEQMERHYRADHRGLFEP
jgi:hypothetical protein